jgi:hypothetical protein
MNKRNYRLTVYARLGSVDERPDKAKLQRAAEGMAAVLNQHLCDLGRNQHLCDLGRMPNGTTDGFALDTAILEEVAS